MVSHYFESHRGGVEIVAGHLARAFARLGHPITWAACDSSPPPERGQSVMLPANNTLERLTGLPFPVPLPGAARRLEAAIRDADAVLVHDGFYLPCLLARRAARRAGKPVVMIQHIGFVPYRSPVLRLAMTLLNRALTIPALHAAAQVVFISDITRRYFAALRFRRPPLVLFNGVDTTIFSPAPPGTDRSALRAALGLPADRPMVLFVGRFVEKKGLAHMEQMARLRPDWSFALAGWGPIDPSRWQLANVHVLPGRAGPSLTPLYQAADALVLPSVGEGFPLVVQEALACGLAVVCGSDTATADPAAAPFIAGVAVQPENPRATAERFAAALTPLLDTPNPSEVAARAAFARARYDWDAMAGELVSVFASVTAAR